jgi:hypothetical protein
MKTVGFLSNKLTLRGTEVAMYDYAHYNEKILGNKSVIITRDYEKIKNIFDVSFQSYKKFRDRFDVEYYDSIKDIDDIVLSKEISHLYIIKAGENDNLFSSKCINLIHCVFTSKQPHGDIYTVIGKTVNDLNDTNYPIVPHMISLPDLKDDIRNELNIPNNSIVFGRYGGMETFDIGFVHETIVKILEKRDDIYFIFMNTQPFYYHPHIHYLDGSTDMILKRKFINTCDGLIHARFGGETFGITCGEFAICSKPVITFKNSREREHIIILKEKAIVYENSYDLLQIFDTFHKGKYDMTDNRYMFYTPENVMEIFNNTFLQ